MMKSRKGGDDDEMSAIDGLMAAEEDEHDDGEPEEPDDPMVAKLQEARTILDELEGMLG